MNKQRIVYLDVIRVIACMMVTIMHAPIPGTTAESHGAFLTLISYLTIPCVPLFIMISGTLLLPCRKEIKAIDYLKKRIGKVAVPTIIFSLFYMFINKSTNWPISILSIPFSTQGPGIFWFMHTLIGLYLLVPIISPWIRQTSKRELEIYLLLWMVTQCYPYLSLFLEINSSNTGILYYFTGYAGYFLLGYYLNRYPISLRWLLPLAILMLPLPLFNKVFHWNLDFYSVFWYLSAPVVIMTVAWFVGIKRLCETFVLNIRISRISDLSFGIYLIHIFIIYILLWNWSVIKEIPNYYLQTVVVALLTFVGSYIVCRIISYMPYSQYLIGYTERNK